MRKFLGAERDGTLRMAGEAAHHGSCRSGNPTLPATPGRTSIPPMSMPAKKLLEEALALPADALRRLDEVRSGKVKTIPAQQVAAELDALLRDAG